jgi:hypothetical protein
MMYNKYVSLNKILEYDFNINSDPLMSSEHKNSSDIREACRAGFYLLEQLKKINCHPSLLNKIKWTAGLLSYKKDPWEIHNLVLEKYKDNTLVLETDQEDISYLD